MFNDSRMAEIMGDRDRAMHAEFYAGERLAIKLPPSFPNLEDDYANKQGLVVPRFKRDMLDDDRMLIDIFNNNEDRLKALDTRPQPSNRHKERVDFDKVDRIIDALDEFKDKYFDDKQQVRVFGGVDHGEDEDPKK
jgi:hypothetical protein